MCDNNADLLQAEGGHSQGDASSKLGEKHVEGVEDCFMAFRVGVGQSEVIHHIWQHRPELHTHMHAELNTHQSVVFVLGFSQDFVRTCALSLLLNITLRHGKIVS